MSVGVLNQETKDRISNQIPDLYELAKAILPLNPDFISIKFEPTSSVPLAAICLQDTFFVVQEVRIALHEGLAHKIWYSEIVEPHDETSAVLFGRFFFDDAALRLYSAAEHLAEAIVHMLGIQKEELILFSKKKTSRQAIIGNYLTKKLPDHTVTKSIVTLVKSPEWTKTIRYRDEWVHGQPQIIEGFRKFKRTQRWLHSETDNSYKLGLGIGDEPTLTLEELQKNVIQASFVFWNTTKYITDFYISSLAKRGISLANNTDTSGELTIKLL